MFEQAYQIDLLFTKHYYYILHLYHSMSKKKSLVLNLSVEPVLKISQKAQWSFTKFRYTHQCSEVEWSQNGLLYHLSSFKAAVTQKVVAAGYGDLLLDPDSQWCCRAAQWGLLSRAQCSPKSAARNQQAWKVAATVVAAVKAWVWKEFVYLVTQEGRSSTL